MRTVRSIPRLVIAAVAAAVIATGLGAGAASASPDPVEGEKLSERLSSLAALDVAADPSTAEAQLTTAATELALPETGPASLRVDGENVAVTITYLTPPTTADLEALAALAAVESVAAKYLIVGASVPAGNLDAVAALGNVRSVAETLTPASSGTAWGGALAGTITEPTPDAAPLPSDSVSAEHCRSVPANLAAPLNVPLARDLYDVDGEGVTVGIISDSFDFAAATLHSTPAQDVAAGLLPGPGNPCGHTTPVQVLMEGPTPAGDEGRAMAQLVHSIAPGAELLFASGWAGQAGFAEAVERLIDAGADIIVDDISYFDEPMFQDGVPANVVSDAVARGVPFFSSAANTTSIGTVGASAGRVISSWEAAEYRPGSCPAWLAEELQQAGVASVDCMDFDPAAQGDTTSTLTYPDLAGNGLTTTTLLQWAEPVGAATNELFVVVTDSEGTIVSASPLATSGSPIQLAAFSPSAGDYVFHIVRDTSDGVPELNPRVKMIFHGSYLRAAEYSESVGTDIVGPSVFGHNGTPAVVSVAAANAATPTELEGFSSTGPMTLYFEPFPSTQALATPISGAPTLTSVDGGWTNFFGGPVDEQPGVYSFIGTSAAAPAAAAVAALGLQLRPEASVQEVREAMTSSAEPIDSIVPSVTVQDSAGAGLVNAAGFLAALPATTPTPTATPTESPVAPTATATSTPSVAPVPVPGIATPASTAVAGGSLATTGTDAPLGWFTAVALLVAGAGAAVIAAAQRRRSGPGRTDDAR